MTLFSALLIVTALLVQAFAVWSTMSNYNTHIDLMKILEMVRVRPGSAPVLIAALNKVSYHQHFNARLFMRDPWKLYDPMIREALLNPTMEVMLGEIRVRRMVEPDDDPPPRVN